MGSGAGERLLRFGTVEGGGMDETVPDVIAGGSDTIGGVCFSADAGGGPLDTIVNVA